MSIIWRLTHVGVKERLARINFFNHFVFETVGLLVFKEYQNPTFHCAHPQTHILMLAIRGCPASDLAAKRHQ
jgi:hypothetical protein